MKTHYTFLVFMLAFLFSFYSPAQTDAIIYQTVPIDYDTVAGNVTFLGPLYTTARTYQLLIHEDQLINLLDKEIQALSWRLPTGATSDWPPTDITVTSYDIWLSGSVPPANRSLTDFSSNVVGPQKQVKVGELFIPMNSYTFGSNPNDWGPEIIFDSLYLYTGGHMLIELRLTGTGNSRSTDAAGTSTPGYGTQYSACWGSGYSANSGSQGNFSIVHLKADDPVPVELTSFTASVISDNVILEWTTATEINNYGFEVERAVLNAAAVQKDWETLGFVSGAGTTTEQRNYSYTDSKIPGGKYIYRLKQIDFNGSFEYSYEVSAAVTTIAVYALEQNYPNPFNPSTKISFSIAEPDIVKLAIYNMLGQEVKLLLNEFRESGPHNITFDASSLPSGVYFYKLETLKFNDIKKMILSK
jgi:hypothetical protein